MYQTTHAPVLKPDLEFSGTTIDALPMPYDSCAIGSSANAAQYRSLGTTETGALAPFALAAADATALVANPSAKGSSRGSHGCLGNVYCFFRSAEFELLFHHRGWRSGTAADSAAVCRRLLRRTKISPSNAPPC